MSLHIGARNLPISPLVVIVVRWNKSLLIDSFDNLHRSVLSRVSNILPCQCLFASKADFIQSHSWIVWICLCKVTYRAEAISPKLQRNIILSVLWSVYSYSCHTEATYKGNEAANLSYSSYEINSQGRCSYIIIRKSSITSNTKAKLFLRLSQVRCRLLFSSSLMSVYNQYIFIP